MKNRIAVFLTTGFLVCAIFVSYTYGTDRNTARPEKFEFLVDWDASEASFERRHGTNWLTLAWRGSGSSELNFWLDESGVAAEMSGLTGHKFRIHVKATAEKIELHSMLGTGWKELSYTSPAGLRRVVVNEYGIRGEAVMH